MSKKEERKERGRRSPFVPGAKASRPFHGDSNGRLLESPAAEATATATQGRLRGLLAYTRKHLLGFTRRTPSSGHSGRVGGLGSRCRGFSRLGLSRTP